MSKTNANYAILDRLNGSDAEQSTSPSSPAEEQGSRQSGSGYWVDDIRVPGGRMFIGSDSDWETYLDIISED